LSVTSTLVTRPRHRAGVAPPDRGRLNADVTLLAGRPPWSLCASPCCSCSPASDAAPVNVSARPARSGPV